VSLLLPHLPSSVVNDPSNNGERHTPLHSCVDSGAMQSLKYLLTQCPSVDVNKVNGSGKTALEMAAALGREDMVTLIEDYKNQQKGETMDRI
jgi:ankyrin repeat protein